MHLLPLSLRFAVERKRTEEELRRSQTELATIYDNVPTMICVLTADRQVLYANRAFADFVGRPAETLKGECACGVIGCIGALDDPRGCGYGTRCETCNVRLAMEDALATGCSHRGLEYRTTVVGRSPPRDSAFLASVAPIQLSGQTNLLLCLEDITARQQAEAAVRESEERHRAVVEDQTEVISRFRGDGTFTFVNSVYCRLAGKPADEILGQTWHLIAVPEDRPRIEEALRTLSPSNPVVVIENRVLSASGQLPWMQFVNRGFFDAQGRVTEIQSVGRDVTQRKQAEEELGASRAQLRALAASLQTVREEERTRIAREIHDVLAQELTRLKLDLAWLRGRLTQPAKATAPEILAERVVEMTEIVNTVIRSVQDIATELRPAVLDSLGLGAAVEWQARSFQARTGIECQANVPESELPTNWDSATAAFRILQESLTNVLRHAQATRVDILLRQDGDHLILKVHDNGCGIRPETLNNPLSIGLAGMRERAFLLGGQCEVRSAPDAGTTIAVRLPLCQESGVRIQESGVRM